MLIRPSSRQGMDDSGWTYHRAYPYGKESQRRQHFVLASARRARLRDDRFSVMRYADWPHCSEGMVQLPPSAQQPDSLAATISGTFRRQELPSSSGWKARAATPMWQPRSQMPRLHTAGYVLRGGDNDVPPYMVPLDTPLKQSRAALASQKRAADERGKPNLSSKLANRRGSSPRLEDAPYRVTYTEFVQQRPDAARRYIKETLPAYYEIVNLLDQADRDRSLKRETAMIHAAHANLARTGLSPPRLRPSLPPSKDPLVPNADTDDDDGDDDGASYLTRVILQAQMDGMIGAPVEKAGSRTTRVT